jgi:dTDP-4-amino-4,6-dideoxygalactose transaminase
MEFLRQSGVDCGIHYPRPVHLQEAYRSLGYETGDFPVAEQIAKEFISLPMSAELTEEQVEYVVDRLGEALSRELVT